MSRPLPIVKEGRILYAWDMFDNLKKYIRTGEMELTEEDKEIIKMAIDMHIHPNNADVIRNVISGAFSSHGGHSPEAVAMIIKDSFSKVVEENTNNEQYIEKLLQLLDEKDISDLKEDLSEFIYKVTINFH